MIPWLKQSQEVMLMRLSFVFLLALAACQPNTCMPPEDDFALPDGIVVERVSLAASLGVLTSQLTRQES